jgi:polyisoprenoid-binding protein YceI
MNKHLSIAVTTLLLALGQTAHAAPAWNVDASRSSLTFKVGVNGETVQGSFPGFGAQIRFDPNDLASSSVKVVMDTSGIRTGDRTRDTMLLKPAWFNVLDFPQATFTCPKFTSNGPGKFVCEGKLAIKGITRDVKLPFTLDIQGQKAVARGSATIRRLDFKVGEGADFATGSPVALDVTVSIVVVATKAK